MCGNISFKRGEAFHRAHKIEIQEYTANNCEAIVHAGEDFYVQIVKDDTGAFQTSCSCPTLASFQKDCQHIAAVLITIQDIQQAEHAPKSELAEGLLSIFQEQPKRTTGHQVHFEDRQVLPLEFICRPITVGNNQLMMGIELQLDKVPILNINDFLDNLSKGKQSVVSLLFTYNPLIHCFEREADRILQELILITRAKYREEHDSESTSTLLLPPAFWERLVPLLTEKPFVKIKHHQIEFNPLTVSNDTLPFTFQFKTGEKNNYILAVTGLNEVDIFESYNSVLDRERIFLLEENDCKRLVNLKDMLEASGSNFIPIPREQIHFFMEKILPGLKKLGIVNIQDDIAEKLNTTPLVAKLFLDRVKNRLLAGVEFQYGKLVINPLERDKLQDVSLVVRDIKKEEMITQLVEDSGFAKTEEGYFLHNEELEYDFLYYIVPKLQKLSQVYATTAVRNRIFKSSTPPNIKVKVKKERTNWLEFKFDIGGIPQEEIKELLHALEEKRKYYRLRNGSLYSLETKEFEEINRFLHQLPIQYEDIDNEFDLPMLKGISFLDSFLDQELFSPEESFKKFLNELTNLEELSFEVPKNLDATLRDYQKEGYRWMKTLASYGFGGILADDMGLGKTLQSIAYIQSVLPEIKEEKKPVLIVCPSSVSYNWLHEFTKFTPEIEAIVVDGDKKERKEIQRNLTDVDVMITSYTLLRKDIQWFENQTFHTVFFDEAQAFKNPTTQTAKAVKKIRAKHRFALTGTPVENSIEELWAIFYVVFPELFKGLKNYANLTRKQIARRTQPFLLRRMKEDVLGELPEKIELQEYVELHPEQKKLYAAYLAKLRHDTLKHLDKETIRKNRIKILAGLTRLRQICCHPALFVNQYHGSSAKFDMLMKLIEEAKLSGRRVLIFSQFTKMLDLIGRQLALKGYSFFYLDGQTPSEERVEICNRFNEGENSFFLISLKAGGTGLNLTGADTVILYDIWWNPAVEEQAADRAHRMGQENPVKVIKLITKGTIEEKMDELQDKKRQLIEEIIDVKAESALTEDDIRELLSIE